MVYRVPISQKSKPMVEDAENSPLVEVGTSTLVVPDDISVREPVVILVNV